MKKKTLIAFLLLLIFTLLGCGKKTKEEKLKEQLGELQNMVSNIGTSSPFDNAPEGMQIVHELVSYLGTLEDPAYNLNWYTNSGKAIDVEIEADFFNKAYAEKDKYIELSNTLTDEYSSAKKAFDEAMKGYDEVAILLKDLDTIKDSEASGKYVLSEDTI